MIDWKLAAMSFDSPLRRQLRLQDLRDLPGPVGQRKGAPVIDGSAM